MVFQGLVERKYNVAMRIKNFKASVLVLLEVLNERTKFLEMDCVFVGHFRPIDDQGSTYLSFRNEFLLLSQAGQKSSERLCCAAGLRTCGYFVTRGRDEVGGFLTVSLSWYRMISF